MAIYMYVCVYIGIRAIPTPQKKSLCNITFSINLVKYL